MVDLREVPNGVFERSGAGSFLISINICWVGYFGYFISVLGLYPCATGSLGCSCCPCFLEFH
jgi:hypothetical protein